MREDEFSNYYGELLRLLSEAELSLGIASGTGLGAVLLALLGIALIRSHPFKGSRLSSLVRAWRSGK